MEILFENTSLIVAIKPPSLLSEQTPHGDGFADLLAAQNGGYIGVIHRLDRGVGGVMVYAKSKQAAARLSAAVQAHTLQKIYLAVVHGAPERASDTLVDLLYHDRIKNKTFVVDRERRGVKQAILDYEVLATRKVDALGTISKLRITLHTGRTHQIRVQMASRGLPLVGDNKYGAKDKCEIALFCHSLAFPHPKTGRIMTFSLDPEGEIWNF